MLYIYIGLLVMTAIWVSKKEALIMGGVWALGLFIVVAIGKEGKEADYIFGAYQAIAAIYMASRVHLKMNKKKENVSMAHTDEPFEFTPLDHEGNDPRLLSKHSIDGPRPKKA